MKKILQIISDTNLGGAGRVLSNYLSSYNKQDYEIHIAVPKGSVLVEVFPPLGGIVHQVEGMADRSYHKEDVVALRQLIAALQPDLIHTHGAFSGRVAGKKEKVPVIFSRHSVFPVSWKKKYPPMCWVNGLLNCYYADGMVAVSPAAVDNLVELGVPRHKITTIFNGVFPLEKTSTEAQQRLRQELSLGEDEFLFGILARLEYYKGHQLLLEACHELKKQGKPCKVLIAGTGAEEEKIKAEIKKQGLEDMVLFLGFWKDVAGLLSILDVQLNCSFGTEATSIALLEGMSLGLPGVVSDYGGNPAVITQGENGLVYPSQNKEALVQAMIQIMEDNALLERCQEGAKKIFAAKFTAQVFARETEEFYDKIIKKRG